MTDEELLQSHLGKERFFEMLELLAVLPNGICGCTNELLFPKLLKHYGVKPDNTVYKECHRLGIPLMNGEQAATPEQFDAIWKALEDYGFA